MADGPAADTSTVGEEGESSTLDGGKRRKSMAERLESGERILSLIEKAEAKRVAKKKIIHFLKRKGVSEAKIIEAYQEFYVKERLYEITFTERPLGFSVIMDTRGNNAIVSSIQSRQNEELGLKVASRMYEVNGKRVDGLKHKQILSVIASCDCPFFIVFKESKRTKKTKAKKLKKLMDEINNRDGVEVGTEGGDTGEGSGDAAVWQSDEESSDSETDSSDESDYEDSEDSEESSGYSSSDDEAHIEAHLERKLAHEKKKQERLARKKRKHRGADPGVFRPNEINEWDEEVIDSEQTEMMKELAKLMIVGAMTSDVAGPPGSGGGELSGMSSKRAKTFEKMVVAATPKGSMDESTVADGPESEVSSGSRPGDGHRKSRSMSFSVTDLMAFEEEEAGYDQEIFGILSNLTGDDLADAMNKSHSFRSSMAVPSAGYGHVTTPSMSAALGAMWSQVELYGDETSDDPTMSLPPGAFAGGHSPIPYDLSPAPGDSSTPAATGVGSYPDTSAVPPPKETAGAPTDAGEAPDSSSAVKKSDPSDGPSEEEEEKKEVTPEDEEAGGDTSVLDTMKGGTTFMKYGRFGRPKYRMFQLTKDHKHLVWFSPRKDQSDTKIPIKYIQQIKIGKESDAATKTKSEDVQETSFTVVYGRTPKSRQSLTVTAKNEKEAIVWAQGLKILADYARQGRDVSKIKSLKTDTPDTSSASGTDPRRRQQSVVIDMDRMRSSSVKALFSSKTDTATVAALRKKHSQLKAQLQKCVDFVMTKSNYRVIKEKGEFDGVKAILEGIDVRLRDTKEMLSGSAETTDISGAKSELFSVHADLDALRHKLTVLVRQQKKL